MLVNKPNVIIDKRPLTIVILTRAYRLFFLALMALLFGLFLSQPPWAGLSPEGYKAIGAFVVCLILWVTQLLPLSITGLLAIVIVPLVGIMPTKEAFSYFGNEAVFFILGAFVLAASVLKTGLSTRLAILFLKGGGKSPRALLWRILFSCAVLSCIMPEHAVAAFFFPIILEMARALEYEPFGGSYGRLLFISMAWGCIIGGIVTFLGGARAPLAMGILREITGQEIGFVEWMKTTTPIAAILLVGAYFVLKNYFSIDVDSVEGIREVLEKRRVKLGLMKWGERWVALILGLAIYCWMFHGVRLGLANIAISAVVCLFIFQVVTWKDVEEYVNWGIILMYGGAICLGRALDSSGAVSWVANHFISFPQFVTDIFGGAISVHFVLFAILSFLAICLTEMVSNAAVVAIFLPVSIGLAQSYHLDPSLMTYVIAIPAGLAFMLPISTPANALAYSSGYLRIRDLLVPGIMMELLAWVTFLIVIKFWWPIMGMGG